MKFPISPRPFGLVELSVEDEHAMVELANVFVEETLTHYESFLLRDNGVVHSSQWKLVKKKENVAVYRQRSLPTAPISSSGSLEATSGSTDKLQVMLGSGTVPGQLDDLMFGVLNSTRESMTLRSSYIRDNVVDCAVLGSVVEPTDKDPVRSVQVKWSVNACPKAVRRLVRPRDFVYLESTGMAQLPTTGERVGYHILHSVEVPGVHELHEYGLVRGNLSLYHIYRQRESPGGDKKSDVEMFVRGFIDLKGDMRSSVATYATADGMIAIWKNMVCAQMKKLAWMYRHRSRGAGDSDKADVQRECGVCQRSFMSMSMMMRRSTGLRTTKSCHICRASVCASCRVTHRLSFMDPTAHRVMHKSVRFCNRCHGEGLRLSGWDLAADEIVRESKQEYPDTMTSSMRSLSLSLGSSPSARVETETESEFDVDDESVVESASDIGSTRQMSLPLELADLSTA